MYRKLYINYMKDVKISEFRQQCLSLMDHLPADGILIVRHGQPIAKVIPVRQSCSDLIGSDPDFLYKNDDDLFSTGIKWDAES